MLVVAVSSNIPTLEKNIKEQGDDIFNIYDENLNIQVFKSLFDKLEQKDIENRLLERHGWTIRVQHDYFVAVDSTEIRYVWLRRFDPQRWLSVYYEPVDDPSILSKEWLLEKRAEFSKSFYKGDYVYQDTLIKVTEKTVDFNGRYAIRLDGVWQNDEEVMGGPFRIYGFYDENDGRIYLIDLAVYAPGERKYPFLRQLVGIASTFRTKYEKDQI